MTVESIYQVRGMNGRGIQFEPDITGKLNLRSSQTLVKTASSEVLEATQTLWIGGIEIVGTHAHSYLSSQIKELQTEDDIAFSRGEFGKKPKIF